MITKFFAVIGAATTAWLAYTWWAVNKERKVNDHM